jgi:hypothetical protein
MSDDYMGVPGLIAPGTTSTYTNINPIGTNNGSYNNNFSDDYMGVPGFQIPNNQTNPSTYVEPTPPSPSISTNSGGSITYSPSVSSVTVKSPVKIATPQYVDFDEASLNPIGQDEIKYLFFEQINGQQLLLLSNTNFVNPENIVYQPIVNISNFKTNYDPKKIIALQDTSDTYFLNFPIKLNNKIPDVPTTESTNGKNVYIATTPRTDLIYTAVVTYYNRYARIVIETKDMENDENIEIQILSGGTIYTDLIEEYTS